MKKNIVAYLIAYIVVVIAVTIFSQVTARKIIGNGFPQNTLIVHYNQGEGDKAASEIQAAGISRNAIEDTKNITVHRASILVSLPFRSIYWFIILGIFVAVTEFAKKFLVRGNQADSTI